MPGTAIANKKKMANLRRIHSFRSFIRLFKESYFELMKNDPLRMAAATAFFTTFALPPILIILTQALGLIFNPGKISGKLYKDLSHIIGRESMKQIIETLTGFQKLGHNWFINICGFIFLVFVATTLFMIIKHSINQLWKIKIHKKESLWVQFGSRILSVVIILSAGVLFIAGLVADGLRTFLSKYVLQFSPNMAYYFTGTLNYFLSLFIVTIWFAVLFRYLPNGRPTWKVALTGAFVTSILFNAGKLILRSLLTYSNIDVIYRTSGSIVLLLLFVFYSSFILYYGAVFTKLWGTYCNQPIRPLPNAMHYRLAEVKEVFL
ncbi:MAG TPA: YihY/virulence factor BrkB family protein [Flavisolibacter sp.]|nr:YihY/virulence factor BrkB family protein [Flavisolibacter sp.]